MYNSVLKYRIWLLGFTLVAPPLAVAVSKLAGEFMWLPAWNDGLKLSALVLLLAGLVTGLIFLSGIPPSPGKKVGWFALLFLLYAAGFLFTSDMQATPCFDPPNMISYTGPGGDFYIYNAGLSPSGSLSCHHSYSHSEIRRRSSFWPLANSLVHTCRCRFTKPRRVGDMVVQWIATRVKTQPRPIFKSICARVNGLAYRKFLMVSK